MKTPRHSCQKNGNLKRKGWRTAGLTHPPLAGEIRRKGLIKSRDNMSQRGVGGWGRVGYDKTAKNNSIGQRSGRLIGSLYPISVVLVSVKINNNFP